MVVVDLLCASIQIDPMSGFIVVLFVNLLSFLTC